MQTAHNARVAALRERYDRIAARRAKMRPKVNARGLTFLLRAEHVARRDWLDALDGK